MFRSILRGLGLTTLATAFYAGFAQQPDLPGGITARDTSISTQIADAEVAIDRATAELEQLRKAKNDLDETLERIDRRAQVHVLGREFARTLGQELRRLPRPEQFAAGREERARTLATTSDESLRVERELDALADLDAAAPTAPSQQREELARLAESQFKLLQVLQGAEEATRELEGQAHEARSKLTQLMFWIPHAPITRSIREILPSLAWTFSPANWSTAVGVLWTEFARSPRWPALALLAAASLLALRGRLQRLLTSLAPDAVGYGRYRIGHTMAALVITFALALPGPIVLWTAASLLTAAPESQAFVRALGDTLARAARLVLALAAFIWLIDRRGVSVSHFGWNKAALAFAARALRRFTALFVPIMFIATLNGLEFAPIANRESLGGLAFSVGMVVCAAFLVQLLRRESPLMRPLAMNAPRSLAVTLHGFWLCALVALPIAMAALAAAGYLTAAGYFFGQTLQSLFVVFGAVMLYGLIALWVRIQRHHLALRGDAQTSPAAQPGAAGVEQGEVVEVRSPQLDVAALGEQTQSLLQLVITLLLVGAIWVVWKDALPILSVISDYSLWTTTATEGGAEVIRPVTVGRLFLAFVVAAVTAVAVRNVGALLDIVLLQRLDVQPDATYAIKVMARYVLAGVGIVLASRILGITWGNVQWLVAALGVGVGFGLQEIVANFISGLILLAERPIRIGDVITVGTVSGTVVDIRARATRVVDFDNKEVLIPNKAFITERVTNWTLSNPITRLVLTFGVASEGDLKLMQQSVLEAVQRNPDVLQKPPPSVFCAASREDALDFEIRAFVDSLDKRTRVQHEIHLEVARVLRDHGIERK